jgi:transposase
MKRTGFLGEENRSKLIALARDGSAASRVTRRADALVLLDDGWSCQEFATALLLDDDTIRSWRKHFEQREIEGPTGFDMGGSAGFLNTAQASDSRAWAAAASPRSTRCVGAWIENEFGLFYESRAGLIALLHGSTASAAISGNAAANPEGIMRTETMEYYGLGRSLRSAGHYETAHDKDLLRNVEHAIYNGNLGVSSGVIGAGKTAALSQLQETLGKEDRAVVATSISVEKSRVAIGTLITALFCDLSSE